MPKTLRRLSGHTRASLRKFGVALWAIVITTWRAIRELPRTFKQIPKNLVDWAKSDYFIPMLMILYFAVEAALVAFRQRANWLTFIVVCSWAAFSQVALMYTKRQVADQKRMRKIDAKFHEAEKQELVNKAIEYKEEKEKMRLVVLSAAKQLEVADERYSELLEARTDEIITEVNRRLSDGEPVQHVFPDVPEAPKAPPEIRPTPPF